MVIKNKENHLFLLGFDIHQIELKLPSLNFFYCVVWVLDKDTALFRVTMEHVNGSVDLATVLAKDVTSLVNLLKEHVFIVAEV